MGKDKHFLVSEQSGNLKTNTYDMHTGDMQDIVLEFGVKKVK